MTIKWSSSLTPTNVAAIMGTDTFYLEGKGMTYGGTGEKVELYDEAMLVKKCDLTVQSHDSQILFECKIPGTATVPVGNYRIKITTLAGIGGALGGTLYTADVKVAVGEAVAPANPTITKVTQDGKPDNTVLLGPNPWTINGTGLAQQTGDEVWVELYDEGGTRIDEGDNTELVTSWTDTAITISRVKTNTRQPDGSWWEAYPRSMVVFIRGGVRHEFPMTFVGS